MDIYPTPAELIRDVPRDQPIIGFRSHSAERAARWFCGHFPAETPYAVKANDPRRAISR